MALHERMIVANDKCKGCRRCEVACIAAHHGMTMKEAMKCRDEFVSRVQVIKTDDFKITVRCHQCENAPCCNVCPTGALQQGEDGEIFMNNEMCIACGLCLASCPYGVIQLDGYGKPAVEGSTDRQVAVRCDMCKDWRRENGKTVTACMEACMVQGLAMQLPDGTIVHMPKPEKKAKPAPAAE